MAKRADYENYIEYRRAVVRESQRRRRLEAKKKGLCCICCLNVPEKGHVTCRACINRVQGKGEADAEQIL